VRAILASAELAAPDANLALLGDKRFIFSESGRSFLMFGIRGRSWIAKYQAEQIRRTGINSWYVPATSPVKLGYDGRWQFFDKFYLGTPFRRLRTAWQRHRSMPRPVGH